MNIEVKFNTLSGPQRLVMDLEEALNCELSSHIKALINDSMLTGMTIQHPMYGKVEINYTNDKATFAD